jgi:hypothetical protein
MNTNLNSFMMKNFYVKLIGDNTNPQLNLEKSNQDENGMTHLNKKLENFMSDFSWLKQAQQMNPVPPPMNPERSNNQLNGRDKQYSQLILQVSLCRRRQHVPDTRVKFTHVSTYRRSLT